jgi:alpha-tubulin suppressor-like RCC1 family protein
VFTKANPGKKVSAGDGFSVFLDSLGDVYTCGKANFGRLGQGHLYSLNNPCKIGWFVKNKILIKDIEAGGRHGLAVSTNGELYGWGFGFYHQLG